MDKRIGKDRTKNRRKDWRKGEEQKNGQKTGERIRNKKRRKVCRKEWRKEWRKNGEKKGEKNGKEGNIFIIDINYTYSGRFNFLSRLLLIVRPTCLLWVHGWLHVARNWLLIHGWLHVHGCIVWWWRCRGRKGRRSVCGVWWKQQWRIQRWLWRPCTHCHHWRTVERRRLGHIWVWRWWTVGGGRKGWRRTGTEHCARRKKGKKKGKVRNFLFLNKNSL